MTYSDFDIIKFLTTGDYMQLCIVILTVFVAISFKTFITSLFIYVKLRLSNIICEGTIIRMHNNTGFSDGIIVHITMDFIIVEVYKKSSNNVNYLHHTSHIPTSKFLTRNWTVIYTGPAKKKDN